MAVSRRTRFEVFRRDNFTCRYCGASAPEVTVTVDHVTPVTLGGSDEPNNLVTACHDCNAGKSSIAPDQAMVEDVDATALMFGKAMERAAEIRRQDRSYIENMCQLFDMTWSEWGDIYRDPNWEQSIEQFLAAGLEITELARLAQVAMHNKKVPSKDVWRYFCGCCWREVTQRQEIARRLIEDGQV